MHTAARKKLMRVKDFERPYHEDVAKYKE